jgi:23S rRNA (uracil1939-C5)-methyltransferase
MIARLLRRGSGRATDVQPTLCGTPADHQWGYRHKVHFVFGNRAAGRSTRLVMGHYARGSRRVVEVRECPVHAEQGNRVAFALRDAFAQSNVLAAPAVDGPADRMRTGVLRSVAVRVSTSAPETMTTLVVANDRDKQLRTATRRALAHPDADTAFHLNVHPRGGAFIFGRDTRCISGPGRLRQDVGGSAFLISPTSFFQTNAGAAEILAGLVLDAIPRRMDVLDLYAGAGLFALPLARRGQRVTAIEENRSAVADGEASARLNRIGADRCRFVASRVETALASIRTAEAIVLDPPRDGCPDAVIGEVFDRLNPKRVVYVSCNPEALARNVAIIRRFPYKIDRVQPVDMFPHTPHIETVVTLSRR